MSSICSVTKKNYICLRIDYNNCPSSHDFGLTDLTSRVEMENSGWTFTPNINNKGSGAGLEAILKACSAGTWYGWAGSGNGKTSATFVGSGRATLDYGNCWISGTVNVYLNDVIIATSPINSPSQTITFHFSSNDVLSVEEVGFGVIKINSLVVNCRGNY